MSALPYPEVPQVDLLALAARDTVLAGTGRERHGPCPLCGGDDRFWVRDDGRWFCRRCTPRGGDAISYVMARDRLTFRQAVAALSGLPPAPVRPAPAPEPEQPADGWQRSVGGLIDAWQEALWAPGGAAALAWLRGRGLADATIEHALLGYCATDAPATSTLGYVRGITIPVVGVDGQLYGVRIRRPVHRDARTRHKYSSVRGSRNALYGRSTVGRTLLVAEGYFDCLLAQQVLGDALDVATLNLSRPAGRWLGYLARHPRILVCLDADQAGQDGAKHWAWMPRARTVALPAGKDITQAVVDHGVDLAALLEEVGS